MSESCLVGLQQVKDPLDSGNLITFIVHKDTDGVITAPTAELFPFLNTSLKKKDYWQQTRLYGKVISLKYESSNYLFPPHNFSISDGD